MVLAQDVIRTTVERNDRERTVSKRLPDTILCRLLGLSGLAWEDQSLLAPIWLSMHQQPDKASKSLVLRTFFQDLGKQVPAFSQFRNSTLFDHIANHKFEPGAGYESCHHGISLLAISMQSFAAQERERQDDNDFDMLATNKTPEAVRKHSSKAPPPLPTTIAELLQLMWRLIVLTTGLFTKHCSLAIQLKDMYTAVQEPEPTIMGNQNNMADLIPQLAWAITTAAREFYGTISTKMDVDPLDDGELNVAIAQLSIHTTMFKAGYRLNLNNLPEQWRHQSPIVTPLQRNDRSTNKSNAGGGGQDRRHGANPFQKQESTKGTAGNNPNTPTTFMTQDLKKLKEKLEGVTLSDIVMEAGIRGGPSRLDTTGLPNNACLNWICMGSCRRPTCRMTHPTTVPDAAALAIYRQIEPGIKRLLETNKRPKQK